MNLKKIIKNSFFQLFIQLIVFVVQLFYFKFVNQNIPLTELGKNALIISFIQFFSVFNVNPISIIWHRRNSSGFSIDFLNSMSQSISLLCSVLFLLLTLIIRTDLIFAAFIYSLFFYIDSIHLKSKWLLEFDNKFIRISIFDLIITLFAVVLGMFLILPSFPNIFGLAVVYALNACLRLLLYKGTISISYKYVKADINAIKKEYFSITLLSLIHRLILSVDKWLMVFFFGDLSLGIYSRVYTIVEIPYTITTKALSKFRFVVSNQFKMRKLFISSIIVINIVLYTLVILLFSKFRFEIFTVLGLDNENINEALEYFLIIIWLLIPRVVIRELDTYYKAKGSLTKSILFKVSIVIMTLTFFLFEKKTATSLLYLILIINYISTFIYFTLFIIKENIFNEIKKYVKGIRTN